jgi:GAF domain-containing protein
MTHNEAAQLATRISQTWPRGLQTVVWEEELAQLDAGRAGTAIERLRRLEQHPPSIARFYAEYHAIQSHDASTRPPRRDCETCQNTGWAQVPGIVETATGPEEMDVGVKPCRCPWGQEREHVHQTIRDWNHAELERLNPGRNARRQEQAA